VGSADQINVIFLEEILNYSLSKRVTHSSVILAPARLALLRVTPKQVAEQAVLRHFCRAGNLLELSHSDKLGRKSTVHTENFVIDEGRNRHTVEHILEFLPEANRIPTFAFVVESVDPVDLTALVVAAKQEEVFLEFDLVRKKKNYCLKGLLSAVDVISQEKVVGLGREASILEKAE